MCVCVYMRAEHNPKISMMKNNLRFKLIYQRL